MLDCLEILCVYFIYGGTNLGDASKQFAHFNFHWWAHISYGSQASSHIEQELHPVENRIGIWCYLEAIICTMEIYWIKTIKQSVDLICILAERWMLKLTTLQLVEHLGDLYTGSCFLSCQTRTLEIWWRITICGRRSSIGSVCWTSEPSQLDSAAMAGEQIMASII